MKPERGRRLLRLFTGRSSLRRELDEELETHVALRAEGLVQGGMSPAEAEREARRRLGDRSVLYSSARRRGQRLRRAEWLGSVRSDLILALRRAAAMPGATGLSLATFALGIGLTTVGFVLVDHVLLRPLPFPEPGRLVALQSVDSLGGLFPRVAAASWREWVAGGRTLESSALYDPAEWSVVVGEGAIRVRGAEVTGDFFRTLRAPLHAGRAFTAVEVETGEALAVVSERFWRAALGGSAELPDALVVEGVAYRVIGVVAESGVWPAGADVWVGFRPSTAGRGAHNRINFGAIARLAPGATIAQAETELSAIARGIRASNAQALYSFGVDVLPLRELLVGGLRLYLLLLTVAVGLVLLIACANLAGLGLARGSARREEMRIRLALGAGRARVLRQLLTEQLLIAAAGGGLGLLLAWSATRAIAVRATDLVPRASELVLDLRILTVAFLITVFAALASGIAPAWQGSSTSLRGDGLRGGVRGGRTLPGAALVVTEVTIALTLLIGAALLLRSLGALLARDLGFRTEDVVVASASLPQTRYRDDDMRWQFWDAVRDQAAELPSVTRAAYAHRVPGDQGAVTFIEIHGRPELTRIGADYRVVSDGYFDVLGVPLVAGRDFGQADRAGSPRVALINRAMADRFWSGQDPLGQQVRAVSMEAPFGAPWITIVGIVGDVRHHGYESPASPEMYVLSRQTPYWNQAMTLVVRVERAEAAGRVARELPRAFHTLDPAIAPATVVLEARIGAQLREQRFLLTIISLFAGFAVVLFAIGLYGALSFAVARRTREIGIRSALGASRSGLLHMMVANAMRVVAAGGAIGLLGGWALGRIIVSLLVETPPTDPAAWALAALLLLAVALLAALIPAWRASRIDPLIALQAS